MGKKVENASIDKSQYIPVYITGAILVLLVVALLVTIFYKRDGKMVVPDKPDYKEINAGSIDFSKEGATNTLDVKPDTKLNVDYTIISDYYKQGVVIADPQISNYDDYFIINGGRYSDIAYISKVNTNSKLEWLTKLGKHGYSKVVTVKMVKVDNDYYLVGEGTKNNKRDLIMYKVNSSGKESEFKTLVSGINNKVQTLVYTGNEFVITTSGSENIKMYYVTKNLKDIKKTYSLANDAINKFNKYIAQVKETVVNGKTVTTVLTYAGTLEEKIYLLSCNTETYACTLEEFKSAASIKKDYNELFYNIDNYLFTAYNDSLYKISADDKIADTVSYKDIKFENRKEEVTISRFKIDSFTKANNNYLVRGESYYNKVYDIYDENFKIQKRYLLDNIEYEYDESAYLTSFYIKGKIYELYLYGQETPSLMVSVIG